MHFVAYVFRWVWEKVRCVLYDFVALWHAKTGPVSQSMMTSILRVLEKERETSEEARKAHVVDKVNHGQLAQAAGRQEDHQESDSDDSWDLDEAEGKNAKGQSGSLNGDESKRLRSRKADKEARKKDGNGDGDGDGDGNGGGKILFCKFA